MEPKLTEHVREVDGRPVSILVDDVHLLAHFDDFFLPFDEVISLVARALAGTHGYVHTALRVEKTVGRSRCVTVNASSGAFWGLRKSRTYPSHLVHGKPEPTSSLCVWGEWTDASTFRLYTTYAGGTAPREIHDPKIPLSEMDAAIAFWTTHALIADVESATNA